MYTTDNFETLFPGWDLYRTVLGLTHGRVGSIGTAGSKIIYFVWDLQDLHDLDHSPKRIYMICMI